MTTTTRHQEMEERAFEFHQENPELWHMFCKFTFELIARGFRHYSAQHGVFARIRWESGSVDANGNNAFKINNNLSAFYEVVRKCLPRVRRILPSSYSDEPGCSCARAEGAWSQGFRGSGKTSQRSGKASQRSDAVPACECSG